MKIIYFLAGLGILFTSCYKKMTADEPAFNVSIDPIKVTQLADTFNIKLGDTARFVFSGDAGNVVFYSGETGKRYEFRNRAAKLGAVNLSFSSKLELGTQTNTLQVLATTKLAGLDSATVVNASWTDITGRLPLATNATVLPTGNIALNDLISSENDSLFIAFKYNGTTGSLQPTWTITGYAVNNLQPPINGVNDVTYSVGAIGTDASQWKSYGNVWSPANAKWVATGSALTIAGGAATAPTNTAWLVSKPLYIGRLNPDIPTATIKTVNGVLPILTDLRPGYTYKYAASGLYKASWVYYNNTAKEEERRVKEFWVRVTP